MGKKPAAFVFLVTFLVYSPMLFNGYVGDDVLIYSGNTFYNSFENAPRLFQKGRILSTPDDLLLKGDVSDKGSGGLSYRPVTFSTFFIDHYFFGLRPYGAHLINVFLHGLNAVLVYWVVFKIFSSLPVAVFSGLLFSLHPIQAEIATNYRSDLLGTFFILSSFFCWIKFRQKGCISIWHYSWALVTYLLAIFSKESAIPYPLAVAFFDQILVSKSSGPRPARICYLGFVLMAVFYLYVYHAFSINVDQNAHVLGVDWIKQCSVIGFIWFKYLVDILCPWAMKAIPGAYRPPIPGLLTLIPIALAGLVFLTVLVYSRRNPRIFFFLIWYIIFYIPVSNVFPLINPMADHYMYLPSIGLLIVLAVSLHALFSSDFLKKYSRHLSTFLHVFVLLVCATRTIFIILDWKNDFSLGWACVRDFPEFDKGYSMLGKEFYNAGQFEKAAKYLEKSVQLGNKRPREVLVLALCYIELKKNTEAEALLKQIIEKNPAYPDLYHHLSVLKFKKNE